MDDDKIKSKRKIQDILMEISVLKKYINELGNNSKGEKLENYIDKLKSDALKAEDTINNIYTKYLS